jgi:trans-aconitate methyltransferase
VGFSLEYVARMLMLLFNSDRYTDILLRRLNPLVSPSFHDYGQKTPMYALDLGCGSGHWLLEAANAWKTSFITGFDLVDTLIPDVCGQDNIRFIQGNLCV